MAYQTIYKDLGIETESSFGASTAGTASRIHVRSMTLGLDVTKELVEDTVSSSKGRDRMVLKRNNIEGDITGYGSPRNLHHAFELVMGSAGVSVANGASCALITYYQNTSGTMLTKAVNVDRNSTQEKFLGVYASSLELTASDDLLEWTLSGGAKSRVAGVALADNVVGETVHPYTYADFNVTIHAGSTYGANTVTHKVSEWNMTYENGTEKTYLSGSKDVDRIDPKIPTVSGMFKIFHEGSSWVSAAYGASEFYLRFRATLPSEAGLIAGVTPYQLTIDIPRSQLTTNVRNYEQNEFAVEEINFVGMMDLSPNGTSALLVVSQVVNRTL